MKNKNLIPRFIMIMCSLICIPGMSGNPEKINELKVNKKGRTSILFDSSWRFYLGDMQDAEKHDFEDSSWRSLDLPHDWTIEDIPGTHAPVDSNAIGGASTGYMVGGTGWYRKTFYVGNDIKGKCIRIHFNGIYMIADIWLNGISLGTHPYGYIGFSYDISSQLAPGKLNTLAVRVKNEGRNTRWYSGSGIYRHVWITATEQLHVDQWGTCITTPEVADNFTTPDKDPYFAALDVCGYNYAINNYVGDHNRLPERIILGTESFPIQAFENWMAVINYLWVIGDFVWTGYDYLGEASIGWPGFAFKTTFYPWAHAYCGDIDICGWKRPQSYYRDALWKPDQLSIFVKSPEPTFNLNPITKVESRWSGSLPRD